MLAPGSPALAQPVTTGADLPAVGTVVQDQGLRQQLEQYFAGSAPEAANTNQRAWTVTPSINVEQDWTDHATGFSNGKSGFITLIRPNLTLNGETARLKATLNYGPQVSIYEPDGNQSRIGHNLTGNALVTLVPETAFIDLRAFATQQPRYAGYAPNSIAPLSRDNSVQTFSGALSPYVQHRFEDWGMGEVGGTVSRSIQSGSAAAQSVLVPGQNTVDENLTSTSEHVLFKTGSEFGRSNGQVLARGTQFSGSGALSNAYRYEAGVRYGYAITRQLTALVDLGWEDIRYTGVAPFKVNDATWAVGGRWTPAPDNDMTLTFGHRDGLNTFLGDASLQAGQRGRFFATYSQGVTSDTEDLQDTLAAAALDPYGNPVSAVNGAPLLAGGGLTGQAGDGTVYRQTRLSAGYSILFTRDTVSLGLQREERHGLTGPTLASLALHSTVTYGSVTWEHELSPDMSLSSYVQYGASQTSGAVTQSTRPLTVSAILRRSLTETLSVYARYTFTHASLAAYAGQVTPDTNLVALGVIKTF